MGQTAFKNLKKNFVIRPPLCNEPLFFFNFTGHFMLLRCHFIANVNFVSSIHLSEPEEQKAEQEDDNVPGL